MWRSRWTEHVGGGSASEMYGTMGSGSLEDLRSV